MTDRLACHGPMRPPSPSATAGRSGCWRSPTRSIRRWRRRTATGAGPIDLVLGAGDLEPSYLGFLADAFGVPLLYVRGNHDVGVNWADARA